MDIIDTHQAVCTQMDRYFDMFGSQSGGECQIFSISSLSFSLDEYDVIEFQKVKLVRHCLTLLARGPSLDIRI